MTGVHCYDILANPRYCEAFQYVPCDVEDRNKFIVDGDSDGENNEF